MLYILIFIYLNIIIRLIYGIILNPWIFLKSIGGFHHLTPKIGGIWGIEKVFIKTVSYYKNFLALNLTSFLKCIVHK